MESNFENVTTRDLRETIESGPLCFTFLFQNKSVAYFQSIFTVAALT